MAVSFSNSWNDLIAEVSTLEEFQNSEIKIVDPRAVRYPGPDYPGDPDDLVEDGYDWQTDTHLDPVIDGAVYSGRARIIPIRAGVFSGGNVQANATVERAVRVQIPQHAGPEYIRKGLTVQIVSAPQNPSLEGRWGSVSDDFQGAASASRTFTMFMDIDGGASDG